MAGHIPTQNSDNYTDKTSQNYLIILFNFWAITYRRCWPTAFGYQIKITAKINESTRNLMKFWTLPQKQYFRLLVGLCGSTSPNTWVCLAYVVWYGVCSANFWFGESQKLSWRQLKLYTSTVFSDDCTLVCKTGMDITLKQELLGMNIFIKHSPLRP